MNHVQPINWSGPNSVRCTVWKPPSPRVWVQINWTMMTWLGLSLWTGTSRVKAPLTSANLSWWVHSLDINNVIDICSNFIFIPVSSSCPRPGPDFSLFFWLAQLSLSPPPLPSSALSALCLLLHYHNSPSVALWGETRRSVLASITPNHRCHSDKDLLSLCSSTALTLPLSKDFSSTLCWMFYFLWDQSTFFIDIFVFLYFK